MLSMTHTREVAAHLTAILDVVRAVVVPGWAEAGGAPEDTPVCVLPALKLLQITRRGLETFRRTWAAGQFAEAATCVTPRGEAYLVLPASALLGLLHHSRHPAGKAYAYWSCTVEAALMAHGWYDPATGHIPPVGAELDALEVQSASREAYRERWGRSWEETWGHATEVHE